MLFIYFIVFVLYCYIHPRGVATPMISFNKHYYYHHHHHIYIYMCIFMYACIQLYIHESKRTIVNNSEQ